MASLHENKYPDGTPAFQIRYRTRHDGRWKQHTKKLSKGTTRIKALEELENFRLSFDGQHSPRRKISHVWAFYEANKTGLSPTTIINYRESINVLISALSDIPVSRIASNLNDFEKYLSRYAVNTRSRHIRQLKAVWNFAIENQICMVNPFRKMKIVRDQTLPVFYTKTEICKILWELSSFDLVLAWMLILYTGMRRCEAVKITMDDFYFEEELIHVPAVKTQEKYIIMLQPLKMFLLAIKPHLPESGPIIRVTPDHITRFFKHAARKAGIEKPGAVHILRHTFASNTPDLETAKLFLGHSSVTTTEIYRHLIEMKNLREKSRLINL